MAELEKYRNSVNRCIRCGICRAKYDHLEKVFRVCPSGEHTAGFWTNFPSGRIALAKEILSGNLDLEDVPVQHVFECLLCGNCRQTCGAVDMSTGEPLIDHPHIVRALRAKLFDSGVELPDAVSIFCDAIEKSANVMSYPNEERADWAEAIKLDPNADTIYFAGCLSSFRETEIAQAVGKVLNILEIPFNILGEEEHCCGNPMLMMGNLFLTRDLMRHNCELMKGKKVITSCAGCYRTLIQDYPKMLGEECTIDAKHIVQVLADQIEQGKVKFNKEVKKKVVYQDPCELGRDMQVFDEPRKILEAIPGLKAVEFESNRERTWCCGGCGGVKGVNYDLAVEIATDKIAQANEVGADVIISACPSCKTNINDGIKATGFDLDMLDILELVLEAGITKA